MKYARSTCRFEALPVNQGDAFLLSHPEARILVDGGANKQQLSSLLASRGSLDIVACTHNDRDQSGGLPAALERLEPRGEVWLLALWHLRLGELLKDPAGFIVKILAELEQLAGYSPGRFTGAGTLADEGTSR